MRNIEQAFEQFGSAVVFSVLDLNSACYQIPLSCKSRRVTAFSFINSFIYLISVDLIYEIWKTSYS
jgi:hypothetical protein